jgi:serine/threonine protein kinase
VTEHQKGQIVFGRYELDRLLAKGGMSQVWVATDRKLKRDVAAKLMSSTYATSDRARQRFEREAMTVAQMQSPHIVQIFDYGVDHRSPFIVMELLSGEDLRRRLKRERRLPLHVVGRLLVQTSMGLSEAHAAKLVHRDLKPANVFLQRSRSGEIVKILDFGVAKTAKAGDEMTVDDELTQAGSMVGTPQYMSPEQVRCLPDIDYRADLWSLGVILFRALTGVLPFKGRSANDLGVNICTGDYPQPSSINPDLPPSVDDYMRIALAKDPGDRFGSAREMAENFAHLTPESYATLGGISQPGFMVDSMPGLPISGTGAPALPSDRLSSPSHAGSPSVPAPSYGGVSITGTGSITSSGSMAGVTGASAVGPITGVSITSTSAGPLSQSVGGSLVSTMLAEAGEIQPRRSWKTRVLIGACAGLVLVVAGVVGSVVGDNAATGPAGSTPPAEPTPSSTVSAAPDELDEEPTPETEPSAVVDLDDGSEEDEEPDKKTTKKTVSKRRRRTPKAGPKPKPKPASGEDWDPFKTRK